MFRPALPRAALRLPGATLFGPSGAESGLTTTLAGILSFATETS